MWKHEHYVLKCLHTYMYVECCRKSQHRRKVTGEKGAVAKLKLGTYALMFVWLKRYSTIKHRSKGQAW